MKNRKPDFYLKSDDTTMIVEPRACYIERRVRSETRDDLLLVRLEPPVKLEGTTELLTKVVLASRFAAQTLCPPTGFPLCVYVGRLKDPGVTGDRIPDDGVELIDWGAVYKRLRHAKKGTSPTLRNLSKASPRNPR
ncbi:MAG: hypothetical protein ACYTAN_02395 [Planctomycetota bacterium]|jgi:hypothetical protein